MEGREEGAGDAAHGAAEGEGDHPIAGDVDADAGGEVLVLPQRAEHPAQAAVGEAPDRDDAQDQEDRRQDVEGDRAVDAGGPRDVDDAAGPLGELAAVEEGQAHGLGQAQGHHGEIDALEAQDRPADGDADGRGHQRRERQAEPPGKAVAGRQDGGGVATDHGEGALGDVDPTDREGDPHAQAGEAQHRGVGQHVEQIGPIAEQDRYQNDVGDGDHGDQAEPGRAEAEERAAVVGAAAVLAAGVDGVDMACLR